MPSVAESLDAIRSALPLLVDLHEQLEVRALRQLRASAFANLFQHGPTFADDHAFLAFTLDDDLAADPRPLPFGHSGGDAVWQLVVGDRKQLLAHQLGDPDLFGLVADRVVGEVQ